MAHGDGRGQQGARIIGGEGFSITPERLYGELERVLTQLGVEIRIDPIDEELNSKGGLCTVKGKTILIVNRESNINEKNDLIIKSIQTLNLEEVYIKPYIRAVIEGGENKEV